MKRWLSFLTCLTFAVISMCSLLTGNPVVRMETDFGSVEIEIYQVMAPVTAANFLRYVDAGLYKDANFYRIVTHENDPRQPVWKINVIQGDIERNNRERRFPPIEHETTEITGILHTDGVISMARSGPGTASSSFFICINDQPSLDYNGERNPDKQGFAAFGKIIQGMDVIHKIYRQPHEGQRLTPIVRIRNIERVK